MCEKKCVGVTTAVVALSLMAGLAHVHATEPDTPACKKAIHPSPQEGAVDVLRDGTVLSWSPGEPTAAYDVYVGDAAEAVEQADRAHPGPVYVSLGQKTTTLDPGRLELGATYYWRVDGVDETDPNAVKVCKGSVWSFTVEAPVLPIGNIKATAACSLYENMGPEKTVDGSGLTGDQHSIDMTHMWLSCLSAPDPNNPDPEASWIQYEFDRVQRLHEMWVWNWNSAAEKYFGLGVRDVTVKYSMNGSTWTALGDFAFAGASATEGYRYNTVVDFAGVAAKYVRIVIKSSQSGFPEYGLSEVKFFALPVHAREPNPAPGTKDVALDGTLRWRAGREAASHKVFIGTDKAAVEKGTAPSFTVKTNRFALSSLELQLEKTYYWRVDEVNDAMNPKSFAGDIWNFTAADYIVVENFESYTNNLASTWKGFADTSVALDKSVVHGGKQSLLTTYNTLSGNNQNYVIGTITSPKNWTKNGAKKLVISYHGHPSNTNRPLYVLINNSWLRWYDEGSVNNSWWGCWIIDVSSAGLTSVDSLVIGGYVNHPGVSRLYIDDIRLYNTKTPTADVVTQLVALNGATKGQFDTLLAAISAADKSLLTRLSSEATYTLFAPTNAAFTAAKVSATMDKAILNDILRNHIVATKVSAADQGSLKTLEGSLLIQDSQMILDDLGGEALITTSADAYNGAVHAVSGVLMPFNLAKIVDILKAMNGAGEYAGQFDTLLAGINAAKPVVREALGKRHCTLFAPTDDACAVLGYDPDTIKSLDQSVLSEILLYHMANGRIMGRDLTASIKTIQGGVLQHGEGRLTDVLGGQAGIQGFDVEGSNGVIYVIDAVLLPFGIAPEPAPEPTPEPAPEPAVL